MADTDAWDADDFEPELPSRQSDPDKWEGEDEDNGAKGDWDEEEDDDSKKDSDSQAYQRPKKKIGEKIAEKEAQEKKEEEEKAKQKEERKGTTAEEKQAEKERIRKIKEQESLSLAKGLFDSTGTSSVDQMIPTTEEEFVEFGEALKNKIQFFEQSQHYQSFLALLVQELSVTMSFEEVKKLSINVNNLYHEKERLRKETEKKKKKKSKASIKLDRADDLDLIGDATGGGGGGYYDDDDFI
ncbi:eukaryotic translation initiation factor 3 subunit J-A-like [Babylonia areolata]|uniref:eukaryotic translation initiation factor 3 subunit J-A-like n=1 Tax=Babylonia areolata TaxID=304850 RepID=UPI003FD0EB17